MDSISDYDEEGTAWVIFGPMSLHCARKQQIIFFGVGYSDDEIEEYLASFDRKFLKVFYEKAKAEDETSIVTKDLDAFINGHAYGYGTRFCLLRYGR